MASRSLNKVMIIGNLTRDPEVRVTKTGTSVCSFVLATNRSWKKEGAEAQEETEFIQCVAWDKLAELMQTLTVKGSKLYVEGRLQTRKYTDKAGVEKYSTEVIVNDMITLSRPQQDGQQT